MIEQFRELLEILDASLESVEEIKYNELVNDCVAALKGGNKVIVSGLGKNVPICEKFVGTMVSLGLCAQFLHTNSAVHGDMGIVKSGDVIILLTKSGETEESIYLYEKVRKRGALNWLISFEEKSTLADQLERKLIISLKHEGDPFNIMPNNSTTINLIVLQGVAMKIAEKLNLQKEDFLRNHPGGHIGEIQY